MKRNWFDCIEELCIVGLAPSGDDIDILKLKKGRGTQAELGYLRFLWGIIKKLSVGRPLTAREAESFTRDLYEHQISYAGAWSPGEKVEIDCAWLRTNRQYVKGVMKCINLRFGALLRSGQQGGNKPITGRQLAGNHPVTGGQPGYKPNKSLADQGRDKELEKDKELETSESATSSRNKLGHSRRASPESLPSAPIEFSASPICEGFEEANPEPVREDLAGANEEAMSEELLAVRRRLAELGDKAVLEEPTEQSEIEVVDLPYRMDVAVFKNEKEHRVKFAAGKRDYYAGKFVGLFAWDNQVKPGPNSGRDHSFYKKVSEALIEACDDRMFCHLLDKSNRRNPNTLVALDVADQFLSIITPEGTWSGDLMECKSGNPKAPLLKGTIEREQAKTRDFIQ